MRKLRVFVLAALAKAALGCFASEEQLRIRAAADFDCARDTLAVTEAKPGVYTVKGCEQQGNYVYDEKAKAWLRESEAGGKVIQ